MEIKEKDKKILETVTMLGLHNILKAENHDSKEKKILEVFNSYYRG